MTAYYIIAGASALIIALFVRAARQVKKEMKGKGSIDFKNDHRL